MNPTLKGWFLNLIKKNNYLHFLSHPKLLTPESIKQFDRFLNVIKKKYKVQYDFKKMNL